MSSSVDLVKTPRSAGCRNCVRARKRCDLVKPECARCVRSNTPCPGYPASIRFVDEGAWLRERHASDKYDRHRSVPTDAASGRDQASICPPARSGADSLSHASRHWYAPSWDEASGFLWLASPALHQTQLLSQLIGSLRCPDGNGVSPGDKCLEKWLHGVAEYKHASSALDSAIRATSLSYIGRHGNDYNLTLCARRQYCGALAQLNILLRHPSRALSLDALVTIVLLSFYETQNCTLGIASWLQHARGATRILQLRGPDHHRHGLAHSTLSAYRSYVIVAALMNGEPCLLSGPRWREILDICEDEDGEEENSAAASQSSMRAAVSAFYRRIIRHPAYYITTTTTIERIANRARLEHLFTEGQTLREGMLEAHARFARSIRAKSSGFIAHIDCVFWGQLCALNRILIRILIRRRKLLAVAATTTISTTMTPTSSVPGGDPDDWHLAEAIEEYECECLVSARKICAVVGVVPRSRFVRPMWLMYALQTALVFLPSEHERAWVQAQMRQIDHAPNSDNETQCPSFSGALPFDHARDPSNSCRSAV